MTLIVDKKIQMKRKRYLPLNLALSILSSLLVAPISCAEQLFKSFILDSKMDQRAIALVDTITDQPRLLEIDTAGKVIWSWSIPERLMIKSNICRGADVKYLPQSDSFLLTLPHFGVVAVKRDSTYQVLLEDKEISHDVHQFANGSLLYARGFVGKNEHSFAVQNIFGEKVWSWTASKYISSRKPYWTSSCKTREKSWDRNGELDWAHANSVEVLENDNFLLSLRNLSAFFEVDKSGQIINEYRGHVGVHEPKIYDGGFILSDRNCIGSNQSNTTELQSIKILDSEGKVSKILLQGEVNTVRGIEVLPSNNLFITTLSSILEITKDGKIVYKAVLNGVNPNLEASGRKKIKKEMLGFCKPKTLYKAVRTR